MSLGPMLRKLAELNRTANSRREVTWRMDQSQQSYTMVSEHNGTALEAATNEPPKNFVKALGLGMDRAASAGRSTRLRRPNFLTNGASDLFNRTERLVKEYMNEDLDAFRREVRTMTEEQIGRETKKVGFLEEETDGILIDERHGQHVWGLGNQASLVDANLDWDEREKNRKLNWDIEDHKQKIKWQTRCWIVSRISEKIQLLASQGQTKATSAQKKVDRAAPRTRQAATDAHRHSIDRTAMPMVNDVAEWNEDEVICIPEQSDTASRNTSACSNVSTNKRKQSESATQASSVDVDIQSSSHRKRQRRDVSKKGKRHLSQVDESHESHKSPAPTDVQLPAQPESGPIGCASESSRDLSSEIARAHAFSDPESQRKVQQQLAAELGFELRRRSYDEDRMDSIFELIHRLNEACEFNQRDHRLYKQWKEIHKSPRTWCGIVQYLKIFRIKTGYKGHSPQAWPHHLDQQPSVEHMIECQTELHRLWAWGRKNIAYSIDFQNHWCWDIAVVLKALLGKDVPFSVPGMVSHLVLYNRDMLDWFRDRAVVVVTQDASKSPFEGEDCAEHTSRSESILEEQGLNNANDSQSTPRTSSLPRRVCATQ